MSRADDFQERRKYLANLSEEELEARFWELAGKLVDPIVELAEKNTSPSIERSILLRMGFSSIEAKSIVDGVIDRGLMGKGAGHIIYRLSIEKDMEIREVGLKFIEGELWEDALRIFKGGDN